MDLARLAESEVVLRTQLRRIQRRAAGVGIAWVLATIVMTVWLSERALSRYLADAAQDAATDTKAITGIVQQSFHELAAMPRVLANSGELQTIVSRYSSLGASFAALPSDHRNAQLRRDADVARVNARLTAVRNELDYDLIYVLDANGIRVVTSDWDQPMTLLGDRLDHREVFKAAIRGGTGHTFAVAPTTKNPVLSFSAAIEGESGASGVVVVRQDSDYLGAMLAGGRRLAMIVDHAGVVVAASRTELALSHVGALAASRPDVTTQRELYGQDTMRTIGVTRPPRPLRDDEWLFEGHSNLLNTADLPGLGYRLMVLSPIESLETVRRLHYVVGAMVAVFGCLIAFIGSRRAEAFARRHHTARVTAALNKKLIALNEEKDRYLGIAAHDLRNPLTSIRGLADLMLDEPFEPEERREFHEIIRRTSDEMLGLVNDLLDTSVIESGKLDLKRKDEDVAKLLQLRLRHLEPHARTKHINLAVEAAPGQAAIDAARYGQVIDNLVSNAIKFSPSGTTVGVALRFDDGHCVFSVQDQGPGIAAGERALLFRSFQKLSARPTGGEKSTGLGLAIVKKIVDAHGGTIEVDDAPGGGTRFTVSTPVAPTPASD